MLLDKFSGTENRISGTLKKGISQQTLIRRMDLLAGGAGAATGEAERRDKFNILLGYMG